MTMLQELKFTDARQRFTAVLDSVQAFNPIAIQPRKASEGYTFLLNHPMLTGILSYFEFKPEVISEDDGSITISVDDLELVVNAETITEALEELAYDLVDYSKRYMSKFPLYSNAPNRRHHLPYVFRVLICQDVSEVKSMLMQEIKVLA